MLLRAGKLRPSYIRANQRLLNGDKLTYESNHRHGCLRDWIGTASCLCLFTFTFSAVSQVHPEPRTPAEMSAIQLQLQTEVSDCPEVDQLEIWLNDFSAGTVLVGQSSVQVKVGVTASENGLIARIIRQTSNPLGEESSELLREFSGPVDCSELLRAVALTLSLRFGAVPAELHSSESTTETLASAPEDALGKNAELLSAPEDTVGKDAELLSAPEDTVGKDAELPSVSHDRWNTSC